MPPRKKTPESQSQSQPPQPPPYPPYTYSDESIPDGCKHTFVINSNLLHTQVSFVQTVTFIRTMVSANGKLFGKAKSNSTSKRDRYPLLEITILYRAEDLTVKLLIKKIDLYVIGFLVAGNKYHYSETEISGFNNLHHPGRYSEKTLTNLKIGPKALIEAIHALNNGGKTVNKGLVGETFFLHFGEGARFELVESLIYKTMASGAVEYVQKTIVLKENLRFLNNNEEYIAEEDDALWLMKEKGHLDTVKKVRMAPFLKDIINTYQTLSESWYVYCLTNEKTTFLTKADVTNCHIGGTETLRHILAILPNIDSERFLAELSKKSDARDVPDYNTNDHDNVKLLVKALKGAGQAFLD